LSLSTPRFNRDIFIAKIVERTEALPDHPDTGGILPDFARRF
jgi:hypothetical protein